MTAKGFSDESETVNQRDDQVINTDDDHHDQEPPSSTEDLIGPQNPDVPVVVQSKKRTKSSHSKKSKSRLKQATILPVPPSSANQGTTHADLINLIAPTKIEDTNGIKCSVIVDTSNARSNLEVVRLCLRELKWRETSSGTALDPDIYWHASSFHEGNTNFALSTGRVNKFPGMNDLLRKVHLTRLLNNMRLLFPNEYDFYPKTWFLPEQNQQFKDDIRYIHQLDEKHHRQLTTFIVKPSDGSQGEGIYLLRDPSRKISTKRPYVVQEYIDRPLLIDGLKFDLRIYVLILNLYPLEIFLYDEGLVRFATIDYKAPSTENLHQIYMHLTNYSLNRRSVNYKHTTNDKQTNGSKRKLSLVWKQLSDIYGNETIERTKHSIKDLINRTIFAVVPELRVEYEFELSARKKQSVSCFQIIGFDIILDDQLKPNLLEVNANPSLNIDFDKENDDGKLVCQASLVDEEIKKPLVLETLKLALPKKKLNAIARHVQYQATDKIIAQRVEKVAQQRLDERAEKLKNARKSRFDMRLNPYFSRPLRSKAQESDHEQRQDEHEEARRSSPRSSDDLASSPKDVPSSALIAIHRTEPIKSVKRIVKRPKQLRRSIDVNDDDESGSVTTTVIETLSPLQITRPSIRPGSLVSVAARTDTTTIPSVETLKLIFSSNHPSKYEHLFLVDKIADIYVQLVIMLGSKTMTSSQFRTFANTCGIIDEMITSSSIDILYYQMLKKWQQFVSRTTITGLPFAAFIEAFFFLSQRKFPSAGNLFDSANQLVNICTNPSTANSQAPISLSIRQSEQYLLYRTIKNNNTVSSSSANIRANLTTLRSSTVTPLRRSLIGTSSTRASKSSNEGILPSTRHSDDRTKPNTFKQPTKSVFPLFFDVL